MKTKNKNLIAIAGEDASDRDLVAHIIQYLTSYNKSSIPEKEFARTVEFDSYDGRIYYFKGYRKIVRKVLPDYDIKKLSDSVSNEYRSITGIDFHKLSKKEKEREKPTYDAFAEKCKEVFGEGIWINTLFKKYIEGSKWIISDLMFPVELSKIQEKKGIIIKVEKKSKLEDFKWLDYDAYCLEVGITPFLPENAVPETILEGEKFAHHVIDTKGNIKEVINRVRNVLIEEGIL